MKAFDKVSHNKLLSKLEMIGIHGMLLKWLSEFLTKRTFQVRINDCFSEPRTLTSGVPQRGVLSPVIFIIYTYEISSIVTNLGVQCKVFADDVKIYKVIEADEDRKTFNVL